MHDVEPASRYCPGSSSSSCCFVVTLPRPHRLRSSPSGCVRCCFHIVLATSISFPILSFSLKASILQVTKNISHYHGLNSSLTQLQLRWRQGAVSSVCLEDLVIVQARLSRDLRLSRGFTDLQVAWSEASRYLLRLVSGTRCLSISSSEAGRKLTS